MSDSQLFEETFTLTAINAQKYDRVSRISAANNAQDCIITLDMNTEIYPMAVADRIHLILASTLQLDGSKDDGKGWRDLGKAENPSLADMYDYVCHGKVYRFEEGEGEMIKVFVSFGGLLLYIEGPYKKLTPLRIDHVYLLIKKA